MKMMIKDTLDDSSNCRLYFIQSYENKTKSEEILLILRKQNIELGIGKKRFSHCQ
jgi:hypothetical protein